tara:strand:- start:3117 stop:4634 length:1518 start_codon:yes stop_codon:yes gene_type:complete
MSNSGGCGKRVKKNETGVRGMSVDKMIQFIKDHGNKVALFLMEDFGGKKPTRKQACDILMTFPRGIKLVTGTTPEQTSQEKREKNAVNRARNMQESNLKKPAVLRKKGMRMRLADMTIMNMKNFINAKGTDFARRQVSFHLRKHPKGQRKVMGAIMRSFKAGRNRAGGARNPMPYKTSKVPTPLKFSPRVGVNVTRRVERKPFRMVANAAERAAAKMFRVAKKDAVAANIMIRRAGLNSNNNNSPGIMKRVMMPVPRAKVTPVRKNRFVPRATDMMEYTVDGKGRFRINGTQCKNMTIGDLKPVLGRAGLSNRTFRNKAEMCTAIIQARRVVPHKTKKQNAENIKEWRKEIGRAYWARENKKMPVIKLAPTKPRGRPFEYKPPNRLPIRPRKRSPRRMAVSVAPKPCAACTKAAGGGRVRNILNRVNKQITQRNVRFGNAKRAPPVTARRNNRARVNLVAKNNNNRRFNGRPNNNNSIFGNNKNNASNNNNRFNYGSNTTNAPSA